MVPQLRKELLRAETVIAEIVRQSGGELVCKTNLYKAFYHAHVEYAAKSGGYLTNWPIVKMPNGPGIHQADKLIAGLVRKGVLSIADEPRGDYTAFKFVLNQDVASPTSLSDDEVAAVKYGVSQVADKSAGRVSHESHKASRSWRDAAKEGDELNVYTDRLPDEDYAIMLGRMRHHLGDLRSAAGK